MRRDSKGGRMESGRLDELLRKIQDVRVAVVGDFCVDAYWEIDPSCAGRSLETGRKTLPVRGQVYSLGGAGNIVQNLAALGVSRVYAVGVICEDLFGREMQRLLSCLTADTDGLVAQNRDWATPVYGKPYIAGEEQPRMDFGVCNRILPETEKRMLEKLGEVTPHVQSVVVNQQLPSGIHSPAVIQGINHIISCGTDKYYLVDSRDYSDKFKGVIHRMNAREAARRCGGEIPSGREDTFQNVSLYAKRIVKDTGKPVFISCGEHGGVLCTEDRFELIQGIRTQKAVDPVGAGDTAVSALAAALAAGSTLLEAAELANYASAVTVRKLRTTGTASPEEILRISNKLHPDSES